MGLEAQLLIGLRILLAAILSMVIGIDREERDKNAGLRTHMLVGIGACLFTALSLVAFPGSDTSRIASNIVTGVGFLGAGVIYRSEHRVHDLTTAASIWLTAALGMAVATDMWLLAIITTLIFWFVLRIMWHLRPYLTTKLIDDHHHQQPDS